MKKLVSFALVLCIVMALFSVSAGADDTLPSMTLGLSSDELNYGGSAQTINLTVGIAPATEMNAFNFTVNVPDGFKIISVSSGDSNISKSNLEENSNLNIGYISWVSSNSKNYMVSTLAVVTIQVPAGAPVGTYNISVNEVKSSKDCSQVTIWNYEDKIGGTAVLKIKGEQYKINASSGTGGSISPSGDVTVNEGGNKTFTITPDEGYEIDDVLVDGNSVGNPNQHTFENVTSNHTISASFKKQEGGSVDPIRIDITSGENGVQKIDFPKGKFTLEAALQIAETTPENINVLMVTYDENHRLLEVQFAQLTDAEVYQAEIDNTDGQAASLNVYVLDGAWTPLVDCKMLEDE